MPSYEAWVLRPSGLMKCEGKHERFNLKASSEVAIPSLSRNGDGLARKYFYARCAQKVNV